MQVLCGCCAGNEELVTLCVFTGYLISSFLEIQGVCKLIIVSLWPLDSWETGVTVKCIVLVAIAICS